MPGAAVARPWRGPDPDEAGVARTPARPATRRGDPAGGGIAGAADIGAVAAAARNAL